MKKLLCGAIALGLVSSVSAASVSGSTDFRVTLPEVLVLYHWDDAHLTLTDPNTFDAANNSDAGHEISDATGRTQSGSIDASSYTFTGSVDTTDVHTNLTGGTVSVVLQNSWAVRSISSGDVTLDLSVQAATLTNQYDSSSTIAVGGAKLTSTVAGVGNSGTASITLPPTWSPTYGNIEFTLDLTSATRSGEYNSRGTAGAATLTDEGTDTFLLTLTGN